LFIADSYIPKHLIPSVAMRNVDESAKRLVARQFSIVENAWLLFAQSVGYKRRHSQNCSYLSGGDHAENFAAGQSSFAERSGCTEPYLFITQTHPETLPMTVLPVDRALRIYTTLANRSETERAKGYPSI
jgi:hypothetical protein